MYIYIVYVGIRAPFPWLLSTWSFKGLRLAPSVNGLLPNLQHSPCLECVGVKTL